MIKLAFLLCFVGLEGPVPAVEGVATRHGADYGATLVRAQAAATRDAETQCRKLRCDGALCTHLKVGRLDGKCTPIENGMHMCTMKVRGTCYVPVP